MCNVDECASLDTMHNPAENLLWEHYQQDLLQPEYYPDPALFRNSLEEVSKDEVELLKNLKSNKNTIRVLAPYLKSMRKQIIQSVGNKSKPLKHKESKVFFPRKADQEIRADINLNRRDKTEMIVSIQETAVVLKSILRANSVVSYLVDQSLNKIHQIPCHVESSVSSLSWEIEPGTTMAAFTAYAKEHVVTENLSADQRFPEGLGFPSSLLKYALCVPIKTPDDKIVAIYEISRNCNGKPFTLHDVQLVLTLTGWMGVAILQNSLYSDLAEQQELSNYLLQLIKHYHSGKVDVDKSLSDFVVFAREAVGAEKCTVFVVDAGSKEGTFSTQEYDQGVDNGRVVFRRRTKKYITDDGSVLSKVFFRKDIVNETYKNTEINKTDDLRATLIIPIVHNGDVLGALKLMNKKGAGGFGEADVEIANLFSEFLSVNILHIHLSNRLKKSEFRGDVLQEMLFHHMSPCVHEAKEQKISSTQLPEDFFSLHWYPSPDELPRLVEITIQMFYETLGESFMVMNDVPNFILTVKNCYRSNPYHNFLHGFSVAHTMANIVTIHQKIFTGLERKGLMVAALCHDVDHRGYNNNFLQLTNHYLANLYETSPLENHHFAVTKMILHHCNMFRYLSASLYNDLLGEIYEDIIATDLSLYFQCKLELLEVADSKTFTFKNPKHRRLVKSLAMTACDLSGTVKPLPISSNISRNVYEEFFAQGDVEKKMGFTPMPTMDRDMGDMFAENQVQFMTVVVLPCVQIVARIFSSLNPLVKDCKHLIKEWKDIIGNKDKNSWKPEESVVHP